ncbi:hypothetical protein F5B21DRAFT_415358 [Xylaria acuta]|nr:hypothetical protein F5B21DRAFT_415358 [Xylaria acuta]
MHPMMDPRRPASDAASYSSSTGSVWSTTDSVSFVYTDEEPWAWWGYEGIRGAVTRKDDRRDDRRIRFAAHLLRGPFAGHKSKKHSSSHHSHRQDSDTRSNYSSSSGHSSSSRRQREFSRGPSPMPPPPLHAYPGPPPPPPPHHQPPQHFDQHFDNFPHGTPMGMRPPPPPPPPMAGPPPQAGFEAGFIQIGGGGGGPPARHDPWSIDASYNGEPDVWDCS